MRKHIIHHDFKIYGANTINSNTYDNRNCTWACHDATDNHCKVHHATAISPYFKYIDPIYDGMINGLQETGDYRGANVILLVLAWPLLMSYLVISVLKMRKTLRHG